MTKRGLYQVYSCGLYGNIESPVQKLIPVQAPSCLCYLGGVSNARVESFRFEEIVSTGAMATQAIGANYYGSSEDGGTGKPEYTYTQSSLYIEKLNILQQVMADVVTGSMTSQVSSNGETTFSASGSGLVGLRVGGVPADAVLDLALFNELNTYGKLYDRLSSDDAFRKRALLGTDTLPAKGKTLMVTLVHSIKGHGLKVEKNTVGIPLFGKVSFAEMTVSPTARSLMLFNVVMEDGPVTGTISSGGVQGGGEYYP